MKTPKEKAEELVDKYYLTLKESKGYYDLPNAQQCALIAVDEICEAINWHEFEVPNKEWDYWNKVKQEIQNL